jgi:predicted XRE-type DNA-binding protein
MEDDDMRNQNTRNFARSKGVRNYEIAEQLGISDNTFYVMMRKNLTDAEKERILTAIEAVAASKFVVSEKELTNLRAIQG